MKTIRLGLIGCGLMMEAHASNINKVEGIEITSVCDIIEERAASVAKALGNNPKITTDFHTTKPFNLSEAVQHSVRMQYELSFL